jgi:hypothetical protein
MVWPSVMFCKIVDTHYLIDLYIIKKSFKLSTLPFFLCSWGQSGSNETMYLLFPSNVCNYRHIFLPFPEIIVYTVPILACRIIQSRLIPQITI